MTSLVNWMTTLAKLMTGLGNWMTALAKLMTGLVNLIVPVRPAAAARPTVGAEAAKSSQCSPTP